MHCDSRVEYSESAFIHSVEQRHRHDVYAPLYALLVVDSWEDVSGTAEVDDLEADRDQEGQPESEGSATLRVSLKDIRRITMLSEEVGSL